MSKVKVGQIYKGIYSNNYYIILEILPNTDVKFQIKPQIDSITGYIDIAPHQFFDGHMILIQGVSESITNKADEVFKDCKGPFNKSICSCTSFNLFNFGCKCGGI